MGWLSAKHYEILLDILEDQLLLHYFMIQTREMFRVLASKLGSWDLFMFKSNDCPNYFLTYRNCRARKLRCNGRDRCVNSNYMLCVTLEMFLRKSTGKKNCNITFSIVQLFLPHKHGGFYLSKDFFFFNLNYLLISHAFLTFLGGQEGEGNNEIQSKEATI